MSSFSLHRVFRRFALPTTAALGVVSSLGSFALADDWPMWGNTPHRNMAAPNATGVPVDFDPGRVIGRSDEIDTSTTKGIKWIAKLGSQSYSNPTIAGGRIYAGTNNESPRDPKYKGDRSVLYCFDEATGELLWEYNGPKLGAGKVSDWEYLGLCSTAAVDGDRVYIVTNLCEVVCLDVNGMADGNQGVQDEGTHLAGGGNPPIEMGDKDADILWRYDMREELGVFPHNVTSTSPLVIGDTVYVATSNGVDWSHINIPNPLCPALIGLDKNTGELIGEEGVGVSQRVMHCNWSSPSFADPVTDEFPEGRPMIVFGAGDGFTYGFDPVAQPDEDDFLIFPELWRIDCNPPGYRFDESGEPIKYATPPGPSELISTPIFYEGKVYAAIGQDPEHGEGVGALTCIDPTLEGDITDTGGIVWRYTDIDRTISTPSAADGLIYAADYSGKVHCLDATTGEVQWVHDTHGHIWGSTLVADGKVYIGNEDGYLTVLKAGREFELLNEIEFSSPIYGSPVVANGVMYVMSQTHLFAFDTE